MTKRQSILVIMVMAAAPFVGVTIAFALAAIMPPGPNVTRASFDAIQEGMTEEDVEQIFRANGFTVNNGEDRPHVKRMDWKANDGVSWARIMFRKGRVSGMEWIQQRK